MIPPKWTRAKERPASPGRASSFNYASSSIGKLIGSTSGSAQSLSPRGGVVTRTGGGDASRRRSIGSETGFANLAHPALPIARIRKTRSGALDSDCISESCCKLGEEGAVSSDPASRASSSCPSPVRKSTRRGAYAFEHEVRSLLMEPVEAEDGKESARSLSPTSSLARPTKAKELLEQEKFEDIDGDIADEGAALLAIPSRKLGEEMDESAEAHCSQLQEEIEQLREEEEGMRQKLEQLDALWYQKRARLDEELVALRQTRRDRERELDLSAQFEVMGTPPGWSGLHWVDGQCYSLACNVVISVNLASMVLALQHTEMKHKLWLVDQFCLTWYIMELFLKVCLHRSKFLIGRFSLVFWNWLDLIIVVSGIMDQWVLPSIGEQFAYSTTGLRASRAIRLLRLGRIMRVIKIGRMFLQMDYSWTEERCFQTFIMSVIALNTLTLGLELDVPWDGWRWVEQVMLAIYSFELFVRMKRFKWFFFVDPQEWGWNCLDFLIVFAGVADQWMVPCVVFAIELLTGHVMHISLSHHSAFISLLRIFRMLRVLRLVRLLRHVKPLFKLMRAVLEAMQGVQWVLFMCLIILYAFAIITTSLIGHGLAFGGEVPAAAEGIFDTVPGSMFYLFKVMNDDQSPMTPLLESWMVRILFVVFMIVSNWAILSILTSVFIQTMISVTQQNDQEEDLDRIQRDRNRSIQRLVTLFNALDANGDKHIGEDEFYVLLSDHKLRSELCDASGLESHDFEDLFEFLSQEEEDGTRAIHYEDFIEKLQLESSAVSERSLFRLEKQIRSLGRRLDDRLDRLCTFVGAPIADSEKRKSVWFPKAEKIDPSQETRHQRMSWLTGELARMAAPPVVLAHDEHAGGITIPAPWGGTESREASRVEGSDVASEANFNMPDHESSAICRPAAHVAPSSAGTVSTTDRCLPGPASPLLSDATVVVTGPASLTMPL